MYKVTKELYQQNIPKCCEFQTVEEHEDNLMLCWGLIDSIEQGKVMNCGICEFNKENQNARTKNGNGS